ncbi:large ribosomal subunit protein P1-like [Ovis aries]|uniref:large ribosomal subunit protein P1-like n=1 Tax=Ovis aries TaxID=9940 RepID=UPI001C2E8F34|nr:large ribosomal subunit protein P1-like [Ovis aries]
MVMEGKINALVKAAGVNTGPSWPGLFAKALASVNIGDLTGKAEASGPEPAAGAPPEGGPAPSTPAALGENKQAEAQKRI